MRRLSAAGVNRLRGWCLFPRARLMLDSVRLGVSVFSVKQPDLGTGPNLHPETNFSPASRVIKQATQGIIYP